MKLLQPEEIFSFTGLYNGNNGFGFHQKNKLNPLNSQLAGLATDAERQDNVSAVHYNEQFEAEFRTSALEIKKSQDKLVNTSSEFFIEVILPIVIEVSVNGTKNLNSDQVDKIKKYSKDKPEMLSFHRPDQQEYLAELFNDKKVSELQSERAEIEALQNTNVPPRP